MKTERLTIRRVRAEDWLALREIWLDQGRSVYAQYDRPSDTSVQATRERIALWARLSDSVEHMFLAVCLQETLIGYIAMNRRENGYETGYCFHSAYHGCGYARESLSAVMKEMARRGLCSHFMAGTALANTPSVRLLTAVGYTLTGTEQVSFYKDEQGRDIYFEGGIFEAWEGERHDDQ